MFFPNFQFIQVDSLFLPVPNKLSFTHFHTCTCGILATAHLAILINIKRTNITLTQLLQTLSPKTQHNHHHHHQGRQTDSGKAALSTHNSAFWFGLVQSREERVRVHIGRVVFRCVSCRERAFGLLDFCGGRILFFYFSVCGGCNQTHEEKNERTVKFFFASVWIIFSSFVYCEASD